MTLALHVLAWLATYALHSTVLLGGAWLATRVLRRRPEWCTVVWRAALLAGLITSSTSGFAAPVQLDAPVGRLQAQRFAAAVPSLGAQTTPVALAAPVPMAESVAMTAVAAPVLTMARVPTQSPSYLGAGLVAGGVAWALLTLLGLIGFVRSYTRLRGRLAERAVVQGGPFWELFHALRGRHRRTRHAQLAVARHVAVPMVVGGRRPTVYVPPRAVESLDRRAQFALLAHELGHLAHADPPWRWLSLLLERVFWFQPLHRVATRELAAASELMADRWAAHQTREPLELARCLAEVAAWVAGPRRLGPALTASEPRSILAARVHSLVGFDAATARRRATPAGGALIGLAVGVLAIGMPRVVAGHDGDESPSVRVVSASSGLPTAMAMLGGPRVAVIVDDELVVDTAGPVPSAPPKVGPPPPKPKEVAKERRRAKKRVREAFRDAKRRGDAQPTPAELHRALTGEEPPPEGPQSVVIIIDGERVVVPPGWVQGKGHRKHKKAKHKKAKHKKAKHKKAKHKKKRKHTGPHDHPFADVVADFAYAPPDEADSVERYRDLIVEAERMRTRMLADAERQRKESERTREQLLRDQQRVLRQAQKELEARKRELQRELEHHREAKKAAKRRPKKLQRPGHNDMPF